MSIQKVLEMADRFIALAEGEDDGGTVIKTPHNLEYQDQRTRLLDFFEDFKRKLRRITNEMGGDLFVLRERKFDRHFLKKLISVYQNLIEIYRKIDKDKPYIAAEKLARYVLDESSIDELEYILVKFVEDTNVDFAPSNLLQHPQITSLTALKELAAYVRGYMEQNPLIQPPGQSAPPAARLPDIVKEYPEFKAEHGDKTNPAVPFSKQKL